MDRNPSTAVPNIGKCRIPARHQRVDANEFTHLPVAVGLLADDIVLAMITVRV